MHETKFLYLGMFIFLSLDVSASSTSFKIPKQKRAYYTFKQACERVGIKDTLIVDAVGVRALNCMGEKVQLSKICLSNKKFKNDPFIRGYVDKKENQVVCQFGKAALLTLSCESDKTRKFCRTPRKSCQNLKNKFAGELDLSHHSRLFKGDNEILRCYYKYSKNEQKIEFEEVDIPKELSF